FAYLDWSYLSADHRPLPSFPTRRSSDLLGATGDADVGLSVAWQQSSGLGWQNLAQGAGHNLGVLRVILRAFHHLDTIGDECRSHQGTGDLAKHEDSFGVGSKIAGVLSSVRGSSLRE